MKTKKNKQQNGEIKLDVQLDKNECDTYYKNALAETKQGFSQKGFRKGKVPDKLIKKNASQRLYLSYEQKALQETLASALQQENIRPVTKPRVTIDKSVPGELFEYKILVDPYPEIKLGNYKNLKVKKKPVKIAEKEIDKALEFLRQSRANFKKVNQPAKKDNQLDISFTASHNDQKIAAGSTDHYPLRLGKSRLHPKFEKQLYGMRAGEEKSFSVDFPKDWPQQAFRNKKIKFNVKVNSVSEVDLPSLNDDFAKSLGQFENLTKLKKSLKEGLGQEKNNKEENRVKEEILQKIIDKSQIEIADSLVEKEREKMFQDFHQRLEKQKINFEKYLKDLKTTPEDFKKNLTKQARKRLQVAFIVNEIAKTEGLFPQNNEVEKAVNENLKKIKNYPQSPQNLDLKQLQSYTFEYLTNQKVIRWLLEKNICV